MARKTLAIEELLEYANTQLARTDDIGTEEFKSGVAVMIEHALRRCDRYNGYMHLVVHGNTILSKDEYSRKYF